MSIDDSLTYRGQFILDGESSSNDTSARDGRGCGPRIMKPVLTTVNGIRMPVYDWVTRDHSFYKDVPGISSWKMATTAYDQQSKSMYACYNTENNSGMFHSSHTFGSGAGAGCGGNRIAKFDSTGNVSWVVGRHAAGGIPNPGEMMSICRAMGTTHGCIVVSDIRNYQYVYDQDGLYIGRLLEKPFAGQEGLPSRTWELCGEQFGGSLIEVKNNATPGLQKGDVLFFGAGENFTSIYRIHGFDNWVRTTVPITVAGGKLVGTSIGSIFPKAPAAKALSLNVSVMANNPVVKFSLPEKSDISIVLYTVLGAKVGILFDGTAEAGDHSVAIGADLKLASRYYLVRMNVGQARITRPLVMVR